MMAGTHRLEYVKARPRRIMPSMLWAVVIATTIGAAFFGIRRGQRLADKYQMTQLLFRCATHSAPVNEVAYESRPLEAARLLKRKEYTALTPFMQSNVPAAGRTAP